MVCMWYQSIALAKISRHAFPLTLNMSSTDEDHIARVLLFLSSVKKTCGLCAGMQSPFRLFSMKATPCSVIHPLPNLVEIMLQISIAKRKVDQIVSICFEFSTVSHWFISSMHGFASQLLKSHVLVCICKSSPLSKYQTALPVLLGIPMLSYGLFPCSGIRHMGMRARPFIRNVGILYLCHLLFHACILLKESGTWHAKLGAMFHFCHLSLP